MRKLVATILCTLCTFGLAWAQQPNILFLMSDDHAANALGAYGGRLASLEPTPELDKLAGSGMLFENAFCTNSICTPSRATLLTGQYSHVNRVTTLNGHLEGDRQYVANLIRDAGYQTAMVGKWHLKREPSFDYYCVLPGQGSYFNPVMRESGQPWPDNLRRFSAYDSIHSTDAIVKASIDWLKQRDKDRPFFLMHHFKAPHDNFENAERYDFLYQDIEIPEPPSLWRVPNHGSAATRGAGTSIGKRNTRRNMGHHMFVDPDLGEEDYKRTSYQRYLKKYLRTVKGVDDGVGRLLAYLEREGVLENTVILYTSDQGFMLGEHDYIDKRWMYDESLQIPLLVRYPGTVEPGSRSDALVNNTDLAPTLLELAGVKPPDFMQGHSLLPILRGRAARRLAAVHLLPLLDELRPSRRASALWRADKGLQADLLLRVAIGRSRSQDSRHAARLGTVRLAQGSAGAGKRLRKRGLCGDRRAAEGRAVAPQVGYWRHRREVSGIDGDSGAVLVERD